MFAGMQRNVHANGGGQVPCPHAPANHYIFGVDVAMLGTNPRDTTIIVPNRRYQRILINLRASVACTFCKSLGDIHGVGVTVGRDMYAAKHIIGIDERHPVAYFVGRYHIHS